jgi:molybdopterin converting factor small subunit
MIDVTVRFHSYFKDLAKCDYVIERVQDGATIEDLTGRLFDRLPQLKAMKKSMLIAVGVEYQSRDYKLRGGDEVSLFPPVQGG